MPYKTLWKSKKYADGRCPFCGARFGIHYPALCAVFMGISLAAVLLLCIFMPGDVLAILAPLLLVFYLALYFALPLFIQAGKIRQGAGPVKKAAAKEPEEVKIYHAKAKPYENLKDGLDGKTVVASRPPQKQAMSPEERYVATAVHRSAKQRPSYETRSRQANVNYGGGKREQHVSSKKISLEEQDFFDNYGG